MKQIMPYLNFDGETRDAMTFYAKCLGSEAVIQTFKDSGMPTTPENENRVLHARINKGNAVLMASDTMPEHPFSKGTNVHINIDCESDEEVDRLFNALKEGGRVTMEVQDTFWNARFGMLVDKFGVQWMFNHDKGSNG